MPLGFESRSLRQLLPKSMTALLGIAIFALTGASQATSGPTLEAFLSGRAKHKLAGLTATRVLESIQSPTPVEVVGTAKGVVQIGDARKYLFEGSGGTWVGLEPPSELSSLLARGTTARWIGMGTRGTTGLQVQLLYGIEHYVISHYDERLSVEAKLPRIQVQNPLGSLSGSIIERPDDPAHLYADFIIRQNAALEKREAEEIAIYTLAVSKHYGIDPRLAISVMLVESKFNPLSRTSDGRHGLGGVPSFMIRSFALTDPYSIKQAIWCVGKRLSNALSAAGGVDKLDVAIAGYRSMGLDGRSNPPQEFDATLRAFVDSVSAWYRALSGTGR